MVANLSRQGSGLTKSYSVPANLDAASDIVKGCTDASLTVIP